METDYKSELFLTPISTPDSLWFNIRCPPLGGPGGLCGCLPRDPEASSRLRTMVPSANH